MTTLILTGYALLGIVQAMRYHRAATNGYSIEHMLMTAFHGLFWWASLLAEATCAVQQIIRNAWRTWRSWPRAERWSRLKHEIKRRFKR